MLGTHELVLVLVLVHVYVLRCRDSDTMRSSDSNAIIASTTRLSFWRELTAGVRRKVCPVNIPDLSVCTLEFELPKRTKWRVKNLRNNGRRF